MMIATNIKTMEQIDVIPCKAYAHNIHTDAVYQYTSDYNNHVVLLITADDYNDEDTLYKVEDRLYTVLYTNPIEYFEENYSNEEAIIEEQLTLF